MNLANIITLFRLVVLCPAFYIVFFSNLENKIIVAGLIFVLAGILDIVDGYIARKYDMITDFGKLMDPLADKLMQQSAILCMAIVGLIPWWVLAAFITKDIILIFGGAFLFKRRNRTVYSKWYGKIGTVILYIVVISILFFDVSGMLKTMLISFAVLWAVAAMALYVADNKKHMKKANT